MLKKILVATVLSSSLLATGATATAAAISGSDCGYQTDCGRTQTRLQAPARATKGDHLLLACRTRVVGATVQPVGTLRIKLVRTGHHQVWTAEKPAKGTRTFRTPVLSAGKYVAQCRFVPAADSQWQGSSDRLTIRVR